MKLIHYPTYVQCPICKKNFKTDLYLRRHLMSSHEGSMNGRNTSKTITDSKISKYDSKSNFKYELMTTS